MSTCMNRRCPNVAEIERLNERIAKLEAVADAIRDSYLPVTKQVEKAMAALPETDDE